MDKGQTKDKLQHRRKNKTPETLANARVSGGLSVVRLTGVEPAPRLFFLFLCGSNGLR